MATGFQQTPDGTGPFDSGVLERALERCYVKTAEALSQAGAADVEDIMRALNAVRESQANGTPADMLDTLARVRGCDEEHIAAEIATLSASVASTMSPPAPSIPFGNRLIAPSAFYESFVDLHELGKVLLTPVLYAEDTDAIGIGSINPVAAKTFSDEVFKSVKKRFGVRPFLTVVSLEYDSWAFLCRKHFELS